MEKELCPSNIGIPELEPKLHWNNSANVLCNYMQKQEYLEMILKNQAIIPRYVIEPLEYLMIPNLEKIAFPMTCFCDIPFSKVSSHMTKYGRYGIALDKQAVIEKFHVQPIHYMNEDSPLTNDFREAFTKYYKTSTCVPDEYKILLDYLLSTLMYMKPISGLERSDGQLKRYIFQDECEWRYIPVKNFPSSLPILMKQNQITDKGRDLYSAVLQKHPETWMQFEWDDVRYIIVPDEIALQKIIEVIKELPLGDSKKYLLISKIEVSKRFSEDLT